MMDSKVPKMNKQGTAGAFHRNHK